MATIRPISDLRNHTQTISDLCHLRGETVFITKNGKEDLVVMSQAAYEQQQARLELYERLETAEVDAHVGHRGLAHAAMMRRLRHR